MEIAYCMTCRTQREFIKEPIYKEFNTSRGKKAMLNGQCMNEHKMSKLCKVRT
jgi:hypothetical protein